MATKTLIPVEEYLRTGFEGPEPDFVEGELVERSAPNYFHSRTQVRLNDAFKPWQDRGELFRASEIRLRPAPESFRVADFALFLVEPQEAIPAIAPVAVVEIISPDDRYHELLAKLGEYESAGIEHIFVVDPPLRKLFRFLHGNLMAVDAMEFNVGIRVPATSIY